MRISINGLLISSVEALRISKQEPQLRVIRCCLRGTLGVLQRLNSITSLECLLRGASKARVLDARAPSKLGLRAILLML
jgi:hypothetical protein